MLALYLSTYALDTLWSRATRSPVLGLRFERGSAPAIPLRYVTDGVVVDPSATVTLSFKGDLDSGTLLIPAVTATKTGSGITTVYTFSPTFLSSEIDALLGDSDSAIAFCEIKTEIGSNKYPAVAQCRIRKNVNQSGDISPGVVTSAVAQTLPTITSLTGTSETDLPYVPTISLTSDTGVPYFIRLDGQFVPVYLESGAADGADPGQVDPLDYSALTNDKHWSRGL